MKLGSDDPLNFSAESENGSLSFARVVGSLDASIGPMGAAEGDREDPQCATHTTAEAECEPEVEA